MDLEIAWCYEALEALDQDIYICGNHSTSKNFPRCTTTSRISTPEAG